MESDRHPARRVDGLFISRAWRRSDKPHRWRLSVIENSPSTAQSVVHAELIFLPCSPEHRVPTTTTDWFLTTFLARLPSHAVRSCPVGWL